MGKNKSLRVYDYINHPYDKVVALLKEGAIEVFRDATTTANHRAHSLASELHVEIGGIHLGANVDISLLKIDEKPKKGTSSPSTTINLEWAASKMPYMFPLMEAQLSIYPLTSTETQLDLLGQYQAPFGILGDLLDAVAGNRIAEASVHEFMTDVAVYVRTKLSNPDQT